MINVLFRVSSNCSAARSDGNEAGEEQVSFVQRVPK